MRSSPVTVVHISSPSYTGTTWLCLLLGSYDRAFTLGPPDRAWALRDKNFEDACRVHGRECPFWSGFARRYDPTVNFYLQLADHAQRDIIVINNPTPAHEQAELRHPDLRLKPIRVVRDGRALACSFARHLKIDLHDAITEHVQHLFHRFKMEDDRDDLLCFRYEDFLSAQRASLERVGRFLGIEYPPDALEYWKFDHHITSGNAGTIALLKFFQGLPVPNFKDRAFYEGQFERMRQGQAAFDDHRWRDELGRRELYFFDRFCGRGNAAWGYAPDAFTTQEREAFNAELEGKAPTPALSTPPESPLIGILRKLGRRRRALLAVAAVLWGLSLVITAALAWMLARGAA